MVSIRNLLIELLKCSVAAVLTASLLLGYHALADSDPKTDDVDKGIPYRGRLEKDGVGVTGFRQIQFTVYDGAGASGVEVWTETQTLKIIGGEFSTTLGSSLEAVLKDADDLYLTVTVDPGGDNVTLNNQQRILPAPYAIAGPSLQVASQLVLESDTTVNNAGTTGPFVLNDGDASTLVMDGNDINASSTLYLNRLSTAGVDVGGDLTTTGTLTVDAFVADINGDMSLTGNLHVDGILYLDGTLDLGRTIETCNDASTCDCSTGSPTGGGLDCNAALITESYPTSTGWAGACSAGTPETMYVICVGMQ